MKPLLFTLALLCAMQTVFATDYYFSSSAGNDSYSAGQAQSPNTPWRTLNKLNALFPSLRPGDAVYLKRGDVFYGSLTVTASGTPGQPITIGAYGSGERPVISGLTTLSAWTSMGGNVWACANSSLGSTVNTVLINNAAQEMGRFPNSDASNKGYLNFESFVGKSSITDYQLSSSPNWQGAEVVIRNRMSILDRSTVTNHSGNTLFYTSGSSYSPTEAGYGYFIQNHRSTLDKNGEWYYEPASKMLYVYFSNNNPYAYDVKASSVDNLITAFRRSYLVFDNLSLKGANNHGFSLTIGDQNRINNCDVLFSGRDGIIAAEETSLVVENSTINYSHNNGIHLQYGNHWSVIRNNLIDNTMPFGGMGQNSDGNGIGLTAGGDGILLEYNQVFNSGFNGIYYFGNNITIKNNFVDRFCVYKNDGGGIYTHVGAGNTAYSNRKIIGNIVLNGQGVPEGTPYLDHTRAEGISLDDAASNVEITGNTIAHCNSYGLFFTNAFDNVATNNTVYNNKVQLYMARNTNIPNNIVANNTITGNIFFSKDPNQMVSHLSSTANDLVNFASFDHNYYVRPLSVGAEIYNNSSDAYGRNTSNVYSVEDWKPRYWKDASSKGSPVQIAAYKVNAVTSGNKFPNVTFNNNIDWVYSWSATNNTVRTWSYGPLDEGCFKLSFNSLTGISHRAVINAQVGSLTAGKTYRLKFSLLGENANNPSLAVYLRLTGEPWTAVSEVKYVKVAPTRTENELIFSVPENVDDASLIFDINDQSTPFWIDNIELVEANVTFTNPDDHLRFEYNASQNNKTVSLDGTYIDAKGNTYSNSITLAPYTSAVLIKQANNTDDTPPPPPPPAAGTCSATGSILREQWDGVQGNSVNAIPVQRTPNSSTQLTVLETRNSGQYTYGARIRGYICAPQTGTYTFWLAGDDGVELWLSTDDNPANKVRIARHTGVTNLHEWMKYSTQQSDFIQLEQGKRYYIEVLHKQGYGGDNVSVAWRLPDNSNEAPIAGNRLSPYIASSSRIASSAMQENTAAISSQAITDNLPEGTSIATFPNPFSDEATIVVQPKESGPATIEVYNTSGTLVQRLFSGQLQAGHSRRFSFNGQTLSAGVYFVRFTTNSQTITQKMTLVK